MNATAMTRCAACEKEGDSLKSCTACRLVKYCNVTCQKAHRKNHKKECKRRLAELLDEALFKEPPTIDCPICFLPLPHESDETYYKTCCGKMLCAGCNYGLAQRAITRLDLQLCVCPFCREECPVTEEEDDRRLNARIESGDGIAINIMGGAYSTGSKDTPLDLNKACEMFVRAGELGCTSGYFNAGNAYRLGQGVLIDMKKAKHYYGLAAMGGDVYARQNLGNMEGRAGNTSRMIKHWLIAARAGHMPSLENIKEAYLIGDITKDEYEKTLRACQKSKDEMKSDRRDKAIIFAERTRSMGTENWASLSAYM